LQPSGLFCPSISAILYKITPGRQSCNRTAQFDVQSLEFSGKLLPVRVS
jgi:hypothetical protein